MTTHDSSKITCTKRKLFGKTMGVAAATAAMLFSTASWAESVTVASWGGAYQAAQSAALFVPGAKKMGITVIEETFGGMTDVRLKVKAGAVEWDLVVSGATGSARAGAEGILVPIDYSIVDVSTFYPGMYTDYCVGSDVYSLVAAWNTETFGENGPQTWADFWDVEKFPGTRALRNKFSGNVEAALMADGVPRDQVYKVLSTDAGLERAINKIRELKPHIGVWWKSGAQHAQLMKDGEVDMTSGWNGRFDVAKKDGAKVSYTFEDGLLDFDCFAIPKGAPNEALAMKFLAMISTAEMQANLPTYITYGPANKAAYGLGKIDDALARSLPSHPDNAAKQLATSEESLNWYQNYDKKASAMFQDMLTE